MMSLAEYYLIHAIGQVVTYTTTIKLSGILAENSPSIYQGVRCNEQDGSPLFVNKLPLNHMAFNSEVALFNLLEDAQTADELLAVIDDYLSEEEV